MHNIPLKTIKDELKELSPNEVMELCVRLAKFKKENKELLGYLLFDAHNEDAFIDKIKQIVDDEFDTINKKTPYLTKKGVQKILRIVKKNINYSKCIETEISLLLYFCRHLQSMSPCIKSNTRVFNIFKTQIGMIEKRIHKLHEDLQFEYLDDYKQLKDYLN